MGGGKRTNDRNIGRLKSQHRRRKEEAIVIWFMSKSHSKSLRPPSATLTPHTFPDLEEKSERLRQEVIHKRARNILNVLKVNVYNLRVNVLMGVGYCDTKRIHNSDTFSSHTLTIASVGIATITSQK